MSAEASFSTDTGVIVTGPARTRSLIKWRFYVSYPVAHSVSGLHGWRVVVLARQPESH